MHILVFKNLKTDKYHRDAIKSKVQNLMKNLKSDKICLFERKK